MYRAKWITSQSLPASTHVSFGHQWLKKKKPLWHFFFDDLESLCSWTSQQDQSWTIGSITMEIVTRFQPFPRNGYLLHVSRKFLETKSRKWGFPFFFSSKYFFLEKKRGNCFPRFRKHSIKLSAVGCLCCGLLWRSCGCCSLSVSAVGYTRYRRDGIP